MTDLSIFDSPSSGIQVPRQPPEGEYLATVTNYRIAEKANENGNYAVNLEFKLQQALQNQDISNVNLNRPYRSIMFVGANNLGYVKKDMAKLIGQDAVDVPTSTPKDWFQQSVGRAAVVTLKVDAYAEKQGKDDMKVTSFKAA